MWEDFGLEVYEEVQLAPLREVGRTEEMAELLLLEEGMPGAEGQAVLEKVVR